jgi:ABC-type lipoprotein export system ATPase subunit
LIIGGSGTGKTTIARELFKDCYVNHFEYTHDSVVDDMPKANMKDIEQMFYAVGFGSVPSWLKPYSVLSDGEKMRVNLARALLEQDKVCFDEFTSVVDRQVARTMCIATNKAIKRTDKQFIAVTCHKDVAEWLDADWIFDTDTMQMVFQQAHDSNENMLSENVGVKNGENLGVIII